MSRSARLESVLMGITHSDIPLRRVDGQRFWICTERRKVRREVICGRNASRRYQGRRIEQITDGTFRVQPGSLFPALHRLEEAGWLTSDWQPSENNRKAKYYTLTKAGKKQLADETAEWNHIALAIGRALKA